MASFLRRWYSTLSRIFARSLFANTLKQNRRLLEAIRPFPGHHTHQPLQQRAAGTLFRPAQRPRTTPPAPVGDRPRHPAAPDAPPPAPRLGHTIRGWAQIDDTELISLKQDARARHSWKAIGQRLHRDPDSCKARWYWLKSSRPELTAPAAETED